MAPSSAVDTSTDGLMLLSPSATTLITARITHNQSSDGAAGTTVVAVVWVMTAIAALFLGARLWTKRRGRARLWWDDYFLLASQLLLVLFAAMTSYCVHYGLGSHADAAGVQQTPMQLGVLIATVFSVLGAAWSKTSFALTLLRITRSDGAHRPVYWAIWAVVISMNIVLTLNVILQFTWCTPTAAAWDPSIENKKCWDRVVMVRYSMVAAAYSAGMDFVLALVPWFVIMKLSMRVKEKLGVMVCMSLGIFAGVMSIMRALAVPTMFGDDYTYAMGKLFIWTAAEVATTIVAASIPVLRVLLSDIVSTRSPRGMTELNTFKELGDDTDGIRVTRTTVVTRSLSRRTKSDETADHEPLSPSTPMTPVPTYHSFIQNKKL